MFFGIIKWIEKRRFREFGTRNRAELLKILTNKNKGHLHNIALERYVEVVTHVESLMVIVRGDVGTNPMHRLWIGFRVLDVIEGKKYPHITIGCSGKNAVYRKAGILADLVYYFNDSQLFIKELQKVATPRHLTGNAYVAFLARVHGTTWYPHHPTVLN